MTQAVPAVARPPLARAPRVRPVAPARPVLRVVPRANARRIVVGFVVLAIVFTLVTAVVFHVVLAQSQLQLDRLDRQIAVARREYEQRRLEVSTLSSPERVTEEAQRIGLELPADPPTYLEVPGAPAPPTAAGETATTLGDWKKVKPHLGDEP
jgi:cell division protein FtsL